MPKIDDPLYVTAVGLTVFQSLKNNVLCPCGLNLDGSKKNPDDKITTCWIHSRDLSVRLDQKLIDKVEEFIYGLKIDDEHFQKMEEKSAEIKGFHLIEKHYAKHSLSNEVGLITSNSYLGWMATFIIERYFHFYKKKNKNFKNVTRFYSLRNEKQKVRGNFTTEEADEIITNVIRHLKENPRITLIRINMTAGDRIFYPYYLYLDNLFKYTKKLIDSEVYMINFDDIIQWKPFPSKNPTSTEIDTIKNILGHFVDDEGYCEVGEKQYCMFKKEMETVSTIIQDCIEYSINEQGERKYYLNLRGKLLNEVYYYFSL